VYIAGFTTGNNSARSWITKHDSVNLQIAWSLSETFSPYPNFLPMLFDWVEDLAVDANNDLYAAGYRNVAYFFDTTSITNVLVPTGPYGESNAVFKKIASANGAVLYRREFDVTDKDAFRAMTIDYNGDLLFAGTTVAFKQNYGFEDALLMKYSVRELGFCSLF